MSGAAVPVVAVSKNAYRPSAASSFEYPSPKSLEDVMTKEGEVLVRLKFSGIEDRASCKEGLKHLRFR